MGADPNCSFVTADGWPQAREFLSNIYPAELAMTGVCAFISLISIIIFLDNVYFVRTRHVHMQKTVLQTVYMIGLTPTLSLIAVFGMLIPRIYIYQDMLIVITIALVMYKFVQLIVAYIRYYEKIRQTIVATQTLRFNLPPCCCCFVCLPTAEANRSNYRRVRWLVLHYTLLSAVISTLTMITWLNGNYRAGEWAYDNPYPYLITTRIVSILVAIWGLNIIVKPCEDAMRSLLIKPKFLALRLSTLIYAIQGLIFDIIVSSSDLFDLHDCFSKAVMGNFYQNMVFCIEMFLLTLLNLWSYRRTLGAPEEANNDAENVLDRDIMEEDAMESQLKLEKIFNSDENNSRGQISDGELAVTGENGVPKTPKADEYTASLNGAEKKGSHSGHTNPIDPTDGEGDAITAQPLALDIRL